MTELETKMPKGICQDIADKPVNLNSLQEGNKNVDGPKVPLE